MHPSRSAAARSLLIPGLGLLLSCGEAPSSGLGVEFTRRELLIDAASLEIRFYRRGTDCASLRMTRPRPAPILGPFRLTLDDAERRAGTVFSTETVPAGVYAVLVDALDAGGGSSGSGCAPEGEVRDGELSRIRVVISD